MNGIKEYFNFNRRERNGTIVLISIIVILLIVLNTMHLFVEEKKYDYSEFEKEIDSFLSSLTPKTEEDYNSRLDQYIIDRYDTLELFVFNPNTTSDNDWLKLGLTEKQIGTINNYLSKGGKFYDKTDFKKMYGIRTKQYQILKPYIDLPEESGNKYNKKYDNNNKKFDKEEFKPDSLFNFNPNNTTKEQWQVLGFSEKQSNTLCNYTSKGGRFYKKEDLLKIYGVKQEQYEVLEPYIVIEKTENKETNEYADIVIELNSATKEDLIKLNGIKDFNAKMIIKYRNLLGGYNNKEQLLEVYSIENENYEKIKNNIEVNNSNLKQIKINFVNAKDMVRHPYIDYDIANKILDYRNKIGAYRNLNQLTEKNIISQEVFDKIAPYLKI